ncbi:glycosyltransferase family 25 protein [Phyllobacterium zundukense]|uniref:Glycosyltransferase family 25 protein n=1 Tax=Phyllobacterium zundukense TaxID=1867719 RepID=A0ACD4D131_9HYPH|nr:glycosyltransferase family 25 protein [Phyllobacterium zundukense]UXN59492.1 glycosyltransferase family 25 protein [Phyllobacterium zundukense]
MTVTAFIIHLKRATKRGEHVRGLIERLPVKAEIVDAVDALEMGEGDIAAVYARSLNSPYYPFELRKSEVACFLSHRKAWAAIIDRKLDAGLIIEDDVEVDAGFAAQLQLAIDTLQPSDYIRFPRWPRGEAGAEIAREGANSIIEPELPGLGMQMQLVGRDAAIALFAATQRFDRPVDTTIQMRWLHPVRVLSARPITIREIDFDLGGSVVQGKNKTLAGRLKREILRPWYRVTLYLFNKVRR